MYDRRSFVTLFGMTLFAGCSGTTSGGGSTPTQSSTPTPTPTDSPTSSPTPTDSPTPTPRQDSDDDGVPDVEDDFPYDEDRDTDSDGDRVADVNDEYPNDPNREADTDGDGVADINDDFPEDSRYSTVVQDYSDTIDLNEDYYQYYEIEPSEEADLYYSVDVRSDVRIDVIFTDGTNFRYFENGDEWEYYADASDLDTLSAEESKQLSTDRSYYLIVDHTDEGGAAPPTNLDNDRITVDVEYALYR